MTATYTFDVFSSLDGYGAASANWTGYWGKQGPELLDHRLALYGVTTLEGPLDWPDATVVNGDAVDVVARRPGWTRSSRVRPTSIWSWSSSGRSTAIPKSSSTDPPSIDLDVEKP